MGTPIDVKDAKASIVSSGNRNSAMASQRRESSCAELGNDKVEPIESSHYDTLEEKGSNTSKRRRRPSVYDYGKKGSHAD